MSDQAVKEKIQSAIQSFNNGSLSENALAFFSTLGYRTDRQSPFDQKSYQYFKDSFFDGNINFIEEKALVEDWKSIDLLFQLSQEEVSSRQSLFDAKRVDNTIIETYLFFVIELINNDYSRTALSNITRELNKVFPMPVMILFKHGPALTLSIINRRLHKRDEQKDVLEKVTLIKDVNIDNPHRAHIEILFDLSFNELLNEHKFINFVQLHNAWQKTLDTKELNKQFYQKLFDWYLWALKHVRFPQIRPEADMIQDNIHQSESLIRLLTRLLFVWFMKEKGLINDDLFNEDKLKSILKGFGKDNQQTVYYKAVLQNLFFATLNKPIKNRKVLDKGFNPKEYGDSLVYRYEELFNEPDKFLRHFENIPFLNGGLFDCLDQKKDKDNPIEIRLDGFTTKKNKQPVLPDMLFFGEHSDDLSADYDDRKKKDITVYGLIEILKQYKFTIVENTPVEEEIALDPELLGKVFENLLASYNPETQTTARKQTGSFYTPREIVNYMVDESLIAYFKKYVADEERLRSLLSYKETEKFTSDEIEKLLNAIDNCRVLDPACGSGAFPMGVLHKMIHILHKLDPENNLWFEKVIRNFPSYMQTEVRKRLELENWNYVRKLGIIQQCIYGIDNQPIATQIAKLRFFISLLVDQTEKPKAENRGFDPLPNLDFKIVTANTLISAPRLDASDTGLFEGHVDPFFESFDTMTDQYFSASGPEDKNKLKNKITTLIKNKTDECVRQIENNYKKGLVGHLNEDKIKKNENVIKEKEREIGLWKSYSNLFKYESVSFFEPKYFFPKVKDGFDVVIGNPPYIQIQNFSGMQEQKDWERQKYETYLKTGDVYCLFYERGYQLLRDSGALTFITSNKWMRANYGKVMRKYFSANGNILQLIDFGDSLIFENATTYTNILVWKKAREKVTPRAWDLSKAYANDTTLDELLEKEGECDALFNEDSYVIVKGDQTAIKRRIEEVGIPLKDWDISIYRGILTGLNEAFIIDGKKKDELIANDPKSAEILKPILRGRDIKRYKAGFADLWLIASHNGYKDTIGKEVPPVNVKKEYPAIYKYLEGVGKAIEKGEIKVKGKGLFERDDQGKDWWNLRDCAYYTEFDKEKVVYAEIVFDSAFYFDNNSYYPEATTFIITGERLKFLTAMLNSKLLTYAFKKFYAGGDLRGDTFRYKKVFIELLPVPKIPEEKQLPFEILVDFILFCKEHSIESESTLLESIIDGLVYDLYFPEEMKQAHCYITDRIAEVIKPFKETDTDEFKKEYIKTLRDFCRNDKIVYHGLIHRRAIKEVQIITGEKE